MRQAYSYPSDRPLNMILLGVILVLGTLFTIVVMDGLQHHDINKATEELLHVSRCPSPYTGATSCGKIYKDGLRLYLRSL